MSPLLFRAPVEPPIRPGHQLTEPRRWGIPGRVALPRPARRRVARFDDRVDRVFDRLRGRPVPDRLFYAVSELGDFSLIWHLVGTARAFRSGRDERALVRLAVCLGGESILVNGIVKSLFRRSRPVWEQARPHPLRRPRSSSFPSGHASSAFTAAGLLSDGDRAWPFYYGLAVLVASSRVYVKIHHASDVVAGVVAGLAMGRVARRAWPLDR